MKKMKKKLLEICQAKDLLNLEKGDPKKLDGLERDIDGLKEVWMELNVIWKLLEDI